MIFSGICLHPFVTLAVCRICQPHVASNVIPLIPSGRASSEPSFLVRERSNEKLALIYLGMQDASFKYDIVVTFRYGCQVVGHSGQERINAAWQPALMAYLHACSAHTESLTCHNTLIYRSFQHLPLHYLILSIFI